MPWNPWIEIVPDETSDEEVLALYQRTREPSIGRTPDVVRLNSLIPPVAECVDRLQHAVHDGLKGLTVREREIAALLVSTYNGCVH